MVVCPCKVAQRTQIIGTLTILYAPGVVYYYLAQLVKYNHVRSVETRKYMVVLKFEWTNPNKMCMWQTFPT